MEHSVRGFARAVWWGSVVGAAPFLAITMPLAMSFIDITDPVPAILFGLLPLIITGTIVLAASLLIGLPLTAVLSQSGRERQRHYAVAGLVGGALVPALILFVFDGGGYEPMLFFSIPGMIAGTVTGLVWGKWREALADEAASAEP